MADETVPKQDLHDVYQQYKSNLNPIIPPHNCPAKRVRCPDCGQWIDRNSWELPYYQTMYLYNTDGNDRL